MRLCAYCLLTIVIMHFLSCQTIHSAVQNENMESINRYLDEGSTVNDLDSEGKPLLIEAVETGNIELVVFLIEKGADIDRQYAPSELTPLRVAIETNNAEITSLLIENGADVTKTNSVGWSPLMSAARDASVDIIQMLVDAGANPYAETALKRTPKSIAIEENRLYVASYIQLFVLNPLDE